MIFDWFHRKFIDQFLECENGQFHCPVIDKPLNEAKPNKEIVSEKKEHRYRYFMPPVNLSANQIDSSISIGKQEKTNTKEEEIKTENVTFSATNPVELSKPELLNRIKKFYIVTSSKKTDEEVLKFSAAFIKGVYSPNIRKFLVVPLPDDNSSEVSISHTNMDLNDSLHNQAKDFEKNLSNVYRKYESTFKDPGEYLDDAFEEEYRYRTPSEKTESPRDSLMKKPLERYGEENRQAVRERLGSILPTIDSSINENEANFNEAEQKNDTRNLWQQSESDGSWWCDLVDIELPDTCQSERSKLKEFPEARETKSVFKLIFEKLLKAKTPDSYNEMDYYSRIMD